MTFTLTIEAALATIGILVAIIGWGINLQRKCGSNAGHIKRLYDYKDAHEKEASAWRAKYAQESAELRGQIEGLAMANGKEFAAILSRLDKMEENQSKQFERLEEKIDRLEDRRRN